MSGPGAQYRADIERFREHVRAVVPSGATVVVVSRGDHELVDIDGLRAWHFPRRPDGVYAGYYPADSAAAVVHLEELRSRGAEYLALPPGAFWWLEYYGGLAEHLGATAEAVARAEDAGIVFRLATAENRRGSAPPETGLPPAIPPAEDVLRPAGRHHTLFDAEWYVARHPDAAEAGGDPLAHFLEHGVTRALDPNPYFDTRFYYAQVPGLSDSGTHAIVHYLTRSAAGTAAAPNPLFDDGHYVRAGGSAARSGATPLEHFVRSGAKDGLAGSRVHRQLLEDIAATATPLVRGRWTAGTILFLTRGDEDPPAWAVAERLAEDHHVGSLLVSATAGPGQAAGTGVVLDDYALACAIHRPSALRLLTLSLAGMRPLLAVCSLPEAGDILELSGVVTVPPGGGGGDAARAAAELVRRRPRRSVPARPPHGSPARRIVVPCSDWAVSGVNASLEAVGRVLQDSGWEVEILFTRAREAVLASAGGEDNLPALPYRFLSPDRRGLLGMWASLVADLEARAPCIMLMAYDFLANGVAPALTERVGAVAWLQADDRDYYEQAYRLGRYCNALVCVSEAIRDRVTALNPAIGRRAHVVHNSSVSTTEVAARREGPGDRLRIAYTGRLVQYQKRILDYPVLARALDAAGVPYEITLIGAFAGYEGSEAAFRREAADHLADGRMKLLGRLPRDRILEVLTTQDVFVLLSDFEGLPLSVVEAMARGCVPVVAQSMSGIPEIVRSGENGLIVEGREYGTWADVLGRLWRDPGGLARMSVRARDTVRDRFTVEQVGARLDGIMRAVAAEMAAGDYSRPPALTWGSQAGDVLPPPDLLRPASIRIPGLA